MVYIIIIILIFQIITTLVAMLLIHKSYRVAHPEKDKLMSLENEVHTLKKAVALLIQQRREEIDFLNDFLSKEAIHKTHSNSNEAVIEFIKAYVDGSQDNC